MTSLQQQARFGEFKFERPHEVLVCNVQMRPILLQGGYTQALPEVEYTLDRNIFAT